ncbi:MAG: flap endonuclease-1 [Candidatus Ranarchaeia archaeon]
MGVELRDLTSPQETTLDALSGRVISIDAMNAIYQFLAIIRQPDGTPLKDAKGRVTSHLSGLFYRSIKLLEKGITPVYVFDGVPSKLKANTINERQQSRKEMEQKWQYALREGDLQAARKYAQGSSRLSTVMKEESKSLLRAMGVPVIQAPSEGEGQAAYLVKRGDAWACASQDYDVLLYGAPRLIRNLTSRTRRKIPRQNRYITVHPEIIETPLVLERNGITQSQLIDIGILVGTDYNQGVPGVGPKTALKLIKKYGTLEAVLENTNKKLPGKTPPVDEIRKIFTDPPLTTDYEISLGDVDPPKIQKLLCDEHQFSLSRVDGGIQRIQELATKKQQTSLSDYF